MWLALRKLKSMKTTPIATRLKAYLGRKLLEAERSKRKPVPGRKPVAGPKPEPRKKVPPKKTQEHQPPVRGQAVKIEVATPVLEKLHAHVAIRAKLVPKQESGAEIE